MISRIRPPIFRLCCCSRLRLQRNKPSLLTLRFCAPRPDFERVSSRIIYSSTLATYHSSIRIHFWDDRHTDNQVIQDALLFGPCSRCHWRSRPGIAHHCGYHEAAQWRLRNPKTNPCYHLFKGSHNRLHRQRRLSRHCHHHLRLRVLQPSYLAPDPDQLGGHHHG
jgi:hypothetical protein